MDLQTNDILTDEVGRRIFDAVLTLDEDALREEFSRALDEHGVDALVADVLVPALRHVGVMWSAGELSVMHEHHASNIVRSVVSGFRGEAAAKGRPRAVLTCPPGELHDLPNHLFSAMLVQRGWAPLVLGATYGKVFENYGFGLMLLCLVAVAALVFALVGVKEARRKEALA